MPRPSRFARTFAVTSCAWFLLALDRLAVTTALPTIRSNLHADMAGARWTVNAHTLTFALLLLGGTALGERFGRRRMFTAGVATFALGATAAALASTVGMLVAARAVEGAGGALFAPLSLALLAAETPAGRRGAVLGAWGGIGGVGVATGPLLGGGLTALAGWPAVFALEAALGLALVVLARPCLRESRRRPGAPGARSVAHLFRSRAFAVASAVGLTVYAALFGTVFLVGQLLQDGLGASPLDAGVRMLPMAAMPMLLAPLGGALADRLGTRPALVSGAALVAAGAAGLAAVTARVTGYGAFVTPTVAVGAGSALFFAPLAVALLAAAPVAEQGRASGVTTVVREAGAGLGVAVLTAVFARHGDLGSAAGVIAGVVPAFWAAAAIAGTGAVAALALPTRPRLVLTTGDTAMPTPLVRAAAPTDRPAIRALLDLAYTPYAAELDPAVWAAYRTDLLDLDRHARHGCLRVAIVDGEVAGYVAFYPDATAQDLGWPAGWASGRALAVHPRHRGHGVAAALMAELERLSHESGVAVFAFHTSRFMDTARALYARMGYRRVPQFDRDMNVHYGVRRGARPWPALAYLKVLSDVPATGRDVA
jgi:MFS family permease/N-acetylglutamate synthase-like GNAT family acetyltransferase